MYVFTRSPASDTEKVHMINVSLFDSWLKKKKQEHHVNVLEKVNLNITQVIKKNTTIELTGL